jgi:hypothetical protein
MLGLQDYMTIQALVKRGAHFCDITNSSGCTPRR